MQKKTKTCIKCKEMNVSRRRVTRATRTYTIKPFGIWRGVQAKNKP